MGGESAQAITQITIQDSIPLGVTISTKIKNKICSNKYIDFRSLVSNQSEDPLSVTIRAGKIDVEHNQKQKTHISIYQWTDAFLTFACIYLQKNPNDACHLLKYCHSLREMSRMHVDEAWRSYDETFRKLRESSTLPWKQPVNELRLKAAAMGSKVQYQQYTQFNGKKNLFRPHRVCFVYNRGEQCNALTLQQASTIKMHISRQNKGYSIPHPFQHQ